MTPKEKAIELANKFKGFGMTNEQVSTKQCALLCVYEILSNQPTKPCAEYGELYDDMVHAESYWQQVKQELEKL